MKEAEANSSVMIFFMGLPNGLLAGLIALINGGSMRHFHHTDDQSCFDDLVNNAIDPLPDTITVLPRKLDTALTSGINSE